MNEKIISLPDINPVEIYGVNDETLDKIRSYYPKLRIVARGLELKVQGEEADILLFEQKFAILISQQQRYGSLSEQLVKKLMDTENDLPELPPDQQSSSDVIVFGNSGLIIKARTPNQRKIVQASYDNDMVFAIGPAGTGKTYTAVALAVRALKNKMVKKIILTRPAVEAGESLGFLPGDLKEKIDPYLRPLYDALDDMIPADKLGYYMSTRVIEIAPLAYMRGRTLDHAYIILDEAQNTTDLQIKMFLTRIGSNAKAIITGDLSQIDLPKNQKSGLEKAARILKNIDGIAHIALDEEDVVRHRLVKAIIRAYDKEKDQYNGQQ